MRDCKIIMSLYSLAQKKIYNYEEVEWNIYIGRKHWNCLGIFGNKNTFIEGNLKSLF